MARYVGVLEVADLTTAFGISLSDGSQVLNLDTNNFWRIDEKADATDSLDTVSKTPIAADYPFIEIITPSSLFTGDALLKSSYFASENGTYTNYGNIVVDNELVLITHENGVFTKNKMINYYLPELTNDPTLFLNDQGVMALPSTPPNSYTKQAFTSQTSVVVNHGFGVEPAVEVILSTGFVMIPENVEHTSVNSFTVTFDESTSGAIIATVGSQDLSSAIIDTLQFNTTTPVLTAEGQVAWNGEEYTLNIETGLGATIQVGQETLMLYYNNTGAIIPNGTYIHATGVGTVGSLKVPSMEIASSDVWSNCNGTLVCATHEVAIGGLGFATKFGKVRDYDATGLTPGVIWLSSDGSGEPTNTRPIFPNYAIALGSVVDNSATGEMFVSITGRVNDTFNDAYDGSFRETIDFLVTSNGTTVTGTLTNTTATDKLTALFSDGFTSLDTDTGGLTITLTSGTATVPQSNYVYVLKSTKALTLSTTGFPEDVEHIKVAVIELLDATYTQTDGALMNQNWNDHIKKEDDNGHLLHISERLRQLGASWDSGALGTLSGTPTNVQFTVTSGKVYQLHKQTFPSQDMTTGDGVHVVNDPTTPYRSTTNLNDITVYSDGSTWNNEWSSVVLWGIANKTGETSHIMVNLPSGGYNSEANAVADASNYNDYTIPDKFKSTGFLIGRYTFRRSGTAFTYNSGVGYLDLRGFVPNTTVGGGSGGSGITEFLGLNDTPSSYTSNFGKPALVNEAEDALVFDGVPLQLPSMTTTVRDAITSPVAGMKIYNTTTSQEEIYNGTSWFSGIYKFMYSLTEGISNNTQYFYSWNKGNIRSGNASGIQGVDNSSPIIIHKDGNIKGASLTLKGAGVQNTTVTYPVTYTAELWSVGFTSEGTKLADIEFSIDNTYTVGTFAVGATNFKGSVSGLSISVSSGDVLALKFNHAPSGSTAASQVAYMLNAFVSLEMEEN